MKTTIKKKGIARTGKKQSARQSVSMDKLDKFLPLWSLQTPIKEVCKKLNIVKSTYYKYVDASEEIAEDFVLGLVDHGMVLMFRQKLVDVQERSRRMNTVADRALKILETAKLEELETIPGLTNLIRTANSTDKLYVEMLDDTKIVNQTMKTLNKVIVNSNSKNNNEGKGR